MIDLQKLCEVAKEAAIAAGEEILKIYHSGDFSIEAKADNSPLTLADKAAHHKIESFLNKTGLPILSEEGRDEALNSAKNARFQSIRYEEKITRVEKLTKRDYLSFDWKNEIPELIQEALSHLWLRIAREEEIEKEARERLEQLAHLDSASRKSTDQLQKIIELIRECRFRHLKLQQPLLRIRNSFLEAQARQGFFPARKIKLPDLTTDVLEPILRSSTIESQEILETTVPLFLGVKRRAIFSLADSIGLLLQPRRSHKTDSIVVQEIEYTPVTEEHTGINQESLLVAAEFLKEIKKPVTLGEILNEARRRGLPYEVRQSIVQLSLQLYADRHADLQIEISQMGRDLSDSEYYGDDLNFQSEDENEK